MCANIWSRAISCRRRWRPSASDSARLRGLIVAFPPTLHPETADGGAGRDAWRKTRDVRALPELSKHLPAGDGDHPGRRSRVRCPGCGNLFRVRGPGSSPPSLNTLTPAPRLAPPPTPQVTVRPTPASQPAISAPFKPAAEPSASTPASRPAISAPFKPAAEALAPTPAPAPLLGLERDERLPPRPKAPAPRKLTPQAPAAPAPLAKNPVWQAERTLDFGAPQPAAPSQLETAPFQPGKAPAAPPTPAAPAGEAPRAAHERARRLARALVSDILVYNQDERDRALHEGNLASALGAEVNRAWDLYKTKVDRQVLQGTSYFKDALNEILADGQKVF